MEGGAPWPGGLGTLAAPGQSQGVPAPWESGQEHAGAQRTAARPGFHLLLAGSSFPSGKGFGEAVHPAGARLLSA